MENTDNFFKDVMGCVEFNMRLPIDERTEVCIPYAKWREILHKKILASQEKEQKQQHKRA